MKKKTIITVKHLPDMKPVPIHGFNKKNNYNFCVYGKSGEGRKVDVIRLMEIFGEQKNNKI